MTTAPKIALAFAILAGCVCAYALPDEDKPDTPVDPAKPAGVVPTDVTVFEQQVKPFLAKYCIDCHGEDDPEAKYTIHDIDGLVTNGKDDVRWVKALEMLAIRDMPPKSWDQPTDQERAEVTQWIEHELTKIGRGPDKTAMHMPEHGNRVNHKELFSGDFKGPAYSKPRAWRISPYIFENFADRAFGLDAEKFSQPFVVPGEKNINDYDVLTADEGTIAVLMSTTYNFASLLLDEGRKPIRLGGGKKGAVQNFLKTEGDPSDEELRGIFALAFKHLMQRDPSAEETEHFVEGIFKKNLPLGGRKEALRYTMMAIMMSNEFVFRMELGLGEKKADGRRMLSSRELGYAIAYTLTDKTPDAELKQVADSGALSSKVEIEKHVRRILEEPDIEAADLWGYVPRSSRHTRPFTKAKILRFFQEYFGYHLALDVFKDQDRNPKHSAYNMVQDADILVLQTLKKEKNILEELLTTNEYYLAYAPEVDRKRSVKVMKDGRKMVKVYNSQTGTGYLDAYNLDMHLWEQFKPYAMPKDQRAGLLTHPAWLVSYSLNFETDPVRRGKWVLERLLAGTVADVPIGVEAQVPEDHTSTLRERFQLVKAGDCWRCHKKMNPYGDPFEAYNDYGKFRTREMLGDPMLNPDRKDGDSKPVNSKTVIKDSGDSSIDGEYDNAVDMVHAIAKSDLARQSFVRHIFRFFMGRNETLDDSPTLVAMDQAYIKGEGNFNEVVVALLLSDSFLYRK